jgi:hypothetical protein
MKMKNDTEADVTGVTSNMLKVLPKTAIDYITNKIQRN